MNIETYFHRVSVELVRQGHLASLAYRWELLVQAGMAYGVGPGDCACQIIANEADGVSPTDL